MKLVVSALMLMLVGTVFAQVKIDARVKPKTGEKKDAKKEEKKLDPKMKATVDALVEKLGNDDRKVRKQAKADLAKLGKAASLYLEPHLKHEDVEIRESVKEIFAAVDPYRGLKPDKAEPGFFRKRALKNGDKPATIGEKKWLDSYRQNPKLDRGEAEVREVILAREKAVAEAQIRRAIAKEKAAMAKAEAQKKAAEEKAEAERKVAEEKAKAEAEKKESK